MRKKEEQIRAQFDTLTAERVYEMQTDYALDDIRSGFHNIKRIEHIDFDNQEIVFDTYEGFGYDETTNTPEEIAFAELNDAVQLIVQDYLFKIVQ